MLSPSAAAEFDSLILKSMRALAQVLDTSEREAPRVAAALGVLRLAERLVRHARQPHAAHARRPLQQPPEPAPQAPTSTHSPAPAQPESGDQSQSPQAPPPSRSTSPAPSPDDPGAPLSDAEVAEMLRFYPYLETKRLRDPDQIATWRAHLIQARYWDNHWKQQAAAAPANDHPP